MTQSFPSDASSSDASHTHEVIAAGPLGRHMTTAVVVGHGEGAIQVGGGAPIVVQSMTNTDTADIDGTVRQVAALARAGSEMVRITVDRDEAAAAVPKIKERLARIGCFVPLIGDFHYIGHKLLDRSSGLRRSAGQSTGSIRATSVSRHKRDTQFGTILSRWRSATPSPCASALNWGSLDQDLLTHHDGRKCQAAGSRSYMGARGHA